MSDVDPMLARVMSSSASVELLADVFAFDVARADPVEETRLASGADLEAIAGEGTGGCYFLCGSGPRRPVVYASSEGQGGLIAANLTAALELVVGLPFWGDCVKFSAGGSLDEMRVAATWLEQELLEDFPHLGEQQVRVRQELGLPQRSADELLVELHGSVASTVPDFVLLGPEGDAYETLFNTFRPSDNPAWR